MARVFMCDHCGEHEAITGNGNQRPTGWASVRVTVRSSIVRGDGASKPVQSELCPKCTPELAEWLGAKL